MARCLSLPALARKDEVAKFEFQKGDRVQWTKSDDDIPEGHIGYVMDIYYDEDDSGKTLGNRLYVKWPNGRWSFKPHTLLPMNLDTDGANQLKLSFKRFDKNGDGKLSEDELVSVLSHLGGEGRRWLSGAIKCDKHMCIWHRWYQPPQTDLNSLSRW